MRVRKASLDELFKNIESSKLTPVELNTKQVVFEIREIRKEQQKILKSLELDVNDLRKIVFTL